MVHPIYLVPISVKNLYSDGIKPSETVRIYLRGKVFINDSTKSDNNKNFSVRGGGNQSKNIVQVSVKNMELTKFSISEIKENIKRCILLNETYYDLHDVYVLLTSMDKSFQLPKISLLDFYNHQQFIINIYDVKKRIFYKRKEELSTGNMKGDTAINSSLDIDNTMIYVFNSQLVNRGRVRLNKKYGTIYVNFEETVSNKVKDAEIVELTEIDKKTLDFNKIYKLKYGGSTTEIYVLSVQTLQQLLENDSAVVIQEVPPTPLTKEQLLGKINLDDLELGELGELGDLTNSGNNEQKSMETKKQEVLGRIRFLSALKMRISKLVNHRDNQKSIEQNIAMKKRGEKEQEKQKQKKKNRLDKAAEIELTQKKMKLQMFYKGLKKYRKKDNVKPIFKDRRKK